MSYTGRMELYHVTNRGVDGRKIFLDTQDYARFVHDLYEFNDTAPALEFIGTSSFDTDSGRTTSRHRKQLVDIHGWELMKNHYHLLLSERIEGGLTLFLRKLSGYARYFNERHKRRGTLLQGRTRKILIARQEHFLYILHYIHLNSLDYLPGAKRWRERDKGAIRDIPEALEYLRNYRWSSYPDYCGMPNFQSILTKTLFEHSLGGDYPLVLNDYLSDKTETDEEIDPKLLEY
jgi:putative transposase